MELSRSQHIGIVSICVSGRVLIIIQFHLLFMVQDEEEEEEAFNQKHALQKAKEVGPMSSFISSE